MIQTMDAVLRDVALVLGEQKPRLKHTTKADCRRAKRKAQRKARKINRRH